jgi:hypothetical protein
MVENEDDLRKFAREIVLKYFDDDEKDNCCSDSRAIIFPIARKKYWPDLHKHSLKLTRSIVLSSKVDDFVQLVKSIVPDQFFIFDKSADGKSGDEEKIKVPSSAVGIYCTIDPRSEILTRIEMKYEQDRADYFLSKKKKEDGKEEKSQFIKSQFIKELELKKKKNLTTVYKSWLHKLVAEKCFLDIDFDVVVDDLDCRKKVVDFFNEHDYWKFIAMILQTRGGYHILIDCNNFDDGCRKRLYTFSFTCSAFPKSGTKIKTESETETKSETLVEENKNERKEKNQKKQKVKESSTEQETKLQPEQQKSSQKQPEQQKVKSQPAQLKTKRQRAQQQKVKSRPAQQWFTVNHSSQVPVPGTLQGGYLVKIIDKETFIKQSIRFSD